MEGHIICSAKPSPSPTLFPCSVSSPPIPSPSISSLSLSLFPHPPFCPAPPTSFPHPASVPPSLPSSLPPSIPPSLSPFPCHPSPLSVPPTVPGGSHTLATRMSFLSTLSPASTPSALTGRPWTSSHRTSCAPSARSSRCGYVTASRSSFSAPTSSGISLFSSSAKKQVRPVCKGVG